MLQKDVAGHSERRVGRCRTAALGDSFGTGAMNTALAVLISATHGLAALSLVFSTRLVSVAVFSLWVWQDRRRTVPLSRGSFQVNTVLMVLATAAVVWSAASSAPVAAVALLYLTAASVNLVSGLHLSARSPNDVMALGPAGSVGLAAGSMLTAAAYALGGTPALLAVASLAAVVQLVELPLVQGFAVKVATTANNKEHLSVSSFRWALAAAAVAFVAYAPLMMVAGVISQEFSPAWVPAAVGVYSASSLLAPVLHRRRGARLSFSTLGACMVGANLLGLLIAAPVLVFVCSRAIVSVLMFTVEGNLRLHAHHSASTSGLAAVSVGLTVGMSLAVPLFGFVADSYSPVASGGLFTGIALLYTAAASLVRPRSRFSRGLAAPF
jgi:hypothetical protein